MDNKDFVVSRESEDDLQPSPSIAAADRAVFAAVTKTIAACAHDSLAFCDRHAMLGGMIQIPVHPAKDVTLDSSGIIHT
jgi:hypothetical protein